MTTAPPLTPASTYLGSSGTYSERFKMRDYSVLAPGRGKIVGEATSDGQPVQGLRVRLGLNEGVMTQWVESDAQGKYEIPVPVGDYRVDAFEIDRPTANEKLAGKIQRPGRRILGQTLSVSAESVGSGPSFEFVDPVEKLGPKGTVSGSDDTVIQWRPFPAATEYEVQLYKISAPGDYSSVERLFSLRERPRVSEPKVRLSELGVSLEPEMSYRYSVSAYNGRRLISETHEDYARPDFSVAK